MASPTRSPIRAKATPTRPTVSPAARKRDSFKISNDEISKYEKPLPFHLDDFMNVLLADQASGAESDWLIVEMRDSILDQFKEHYIHSSKTRLALSNMDKDIVWANIDEKILRLTKRNLATVDPKFITQIDEYCLEIYKSQIDPMQQKTRAILEAIYATDDEINRVESRMEQGLGDKIYQFSSVVVHRKVFDEYLKELQRKYAVVEYARKRELFLINLVKWEAANKQQTALPAKGKQNLNNWIPKFRISVVKIFERSNATLEGLISNYEKESHKTFELYGHVYATEFLKKQIAQLANVKTNFSHFTADILFFDNPRGDADGHTIVGQILDPCIKDDAESSGALQLPQPPEMPIYAEEVGFFFEYY